MGCHLSVKTTHSLRAARSGPHHMERFISVSAAAVAGGPHTGQKAKEESPRTELSALGAKVSAPQRFQPDI